MKKMIFLLGLVLLGGTSADAQTVSTYAERIKMEMSTPTGSCTAAEVRSMDNGALYSCQNGVWGMAAAPGGGATSVANSDGTLTISPMTGAVIASIALGHANTWTAAQGISSNAASAFFVGPNGDTNALFRVVANVANAATGVSVTGNAAGSGALISAISSAASEELLLRGKGSNGVRVQTSGGTGLMVFDRAGNGRVEFMSDTITDLGSVEGWSFQSGKMVVGSGFLVSWRSGTQWYGGSDDLSILRSAAGVLRVGNGNGNSGAGQLLVGTSSESATGQLSSFSASTTRAAIFGQAASGTAASQKSLILNDGSGAETFSVTAAGTTVASGTLTGKHLLGGGSAPAVSNTSANSCGTTAASLVGTDTAGKVTVGATAGTSCTITFVASWANAPACVVTNETSANLARATSTTTTVIVAGTFVAGDVLAYSCVGY